MGYKSTLGQHYCVILIWMATIAFTSAQMNIVPSADGSYRVNIQEMTWLHSGPTFFYNNGKKFSTDDDTLKMVYPPETSAGMDSLGEWTMVNYTYGTNGAYGQDKVNVQIRSYKDLPIIVFSQLFRDGVMKTRQGDMHSVISGFPTFYTDGDPNLGFLDYGGLFIGWVKLAAGRWNFNMSHLADGMEGGPLVLFDRNENAVVISSFSEFMAASFQHDTKTKTVSWGIMGEVDQIPDGYSVEFIMYYSDKGINQAMEGWGRCLQKWYRKDPHYKEEDPSIKYIGYYTDNGAYYYHATEPDMNYEDTMLGVFNYSKQQNIPYRYLQYDDWWYPIAGQGYGATVTWDAMPKIFPHGLRYLYTISKLPVVAHNRYWSNITTYAKQNGGKYDFIIDKDKSLPVEQKFWDDLFATAIQWGLIVYEQDWLNYQTESIKQLYSDLTLGRQWLMQMGEAASRYGIRLQYCMALPRHLLQSVEIPAVTQVRASTDYAMKEHVQWKTGITSIFAHSLGVAPFKDNFWTVSDQPGNKYKYTEPYPEFQTVAALLTTGPVGPSDRIGYSNATLMKKCHAADGLLLKPSKPATAVDDQILQWAFGGDTTQLDDGAEVWTTYSDISEIRFGIIFSGEQKGAYNIGPTRAGFGYKFQRSIVYQYGFDSMRDMVQLFSDENPLELEDCTQETFCLFYTSPVFNWREMTIIFLGELEKFVPISPQRVKSLSVGDSDIQLTLAGSPREVVKFYVSLSIATHGAAFPITCSISSQGFAILSIADRSCH